MSNPRVDKMKGSYIRTMMERADELEKMGRQIVHLEVGEPDFDTPRPIIEATVEALKDGHTHYAPDEGLDELREVVARRFIRDKGITVDPYKNVLITNGASEGIFAAIIGLTGPGHGVLIPEPAFGNYHNCCLCAGSQPINVPLKLDTTCRLDFPSLESAIDENTRYLIINNPHNPTGGMFSSKEIEKLAKFALKHDLLVITDEIYEEIYYGDEKPLSIGSLPGMQERTVMIGGFSKTYAMTGWRVGYAVAPENLIEPMQKVHQYAVTCVATFSQIGIARGIEESKEDAIKMKEELARRKDYLTNKMDDIKGISYIVPEGAFYLFINISRFGLSSQEFSRRLLEEKGLATIPGSTFGRSGEGFIRISYAASFEEVQKGTDILKNFIEEYHRDGSLD